MRPFRKYQDPPASAAQAFARGVHDYWGVGVDTPCGGTGILLLVSDLDRTVYISVGRALQTTVLTDRRIDRVIENMKPFFQRQQYKDAVVHAINEMVYLIHSGPPDLYERAVDFLTQYSGLLWMAAIFGFVFTSARRQRAQQRQYAAAAAHLDELERARAQALQGHFQMESCPICLEAFPKEEQDGQEQQQQQENANHHPTITTMGSDGQPIKLLRCGHCFDESCWAEWVNTGRGQVDKCPVCQQSVGRRSPPEEPQTTANTRRAPRTRTTTTTTEHSPQDTPGETRSADVSTYGMDDPTAAADMDPLLNNSNSNSNNNAAQPQADEPLQLRALQRYQHERNFRLARLAVRYPRYITQQHVQRWTSSTYNGQMVRDPSFVQNDPSRQHHHHHHNAQQSTTNNDRSRTSRSSGGSSAPRVSTFGGGKSGGGRAGRW